MVHWKQRRILAWLAGFLGAAAVGVVLLLPSEAERAGGYESMVSFRVVGESGQGQSFALRQRLRRLASVAADSVTVTSDPEDHGHSFTVTLQSVDQSRTQFEAAVRSFTRAAVATNFGLTGAAERTHRRELATSELRRRQSEMQQEIDALVADVGDAADLPVEVRLRVTSLEAASLRLEDQYRQLTRELRDHPGEEGTSLELVSGPSAPVPTESARSTPTSAFASLAGGLFGLFWVLLLPIVRRRPD